MTPVKPRNRIPDDEQEKQPNGYIKFTNRIEGLIRRPKKVDVAVVILALLSAIVGTVATLLSWFK